MVMWRWAQSIVSPKELWAKWERKGKPLHSNKTQRRNFHHPGSSSGFPEIQQNYLLSLISAPVSTFSLLASSLLDYLKADKRINY
jgi:hypothetical protein